MNDLVKALLTNKTIFTLELQQNPGYTPQIAEALLGQLDDNVQEYRRSVQTILTNQSRSFMTTSSLSKLRPSTTKGEDKSKFLKSSLAKSQVTRPGLGKQKIGNMPSDFFRTQTSGTTDTSRTIKIGRDIPLYIDEANLFSSLVKEIPKSTKPKVNI